MWTSAFVCRFVVLRRVTLWFCSSSVHHAPVEESLLSAGALSRHPCRPVGQRVGGAASAPTGADTVRVSWRRGGGRWRRWRLCWRDWWDDKNTCVLHIFFSPEVAVFSCHSTTVYVYTELAGKGNGHLAAVPALDIYPECTTDWRPHFNTLVHRHKPTNVRWWREGRSTTAGNFTSRYCLILHTVVPLTYM